VSPFLKERVYLGSPVVSYRWNEYCRFWQWIW